jgi:hypothetical protein
MQVTKVLLEGFVEKSLSISYQATIAKGSLRLVADIDIEATIYLYICFNSGFDLDTANRPVAFVRRWGFRVLFKRTAHHCGDDFGYRTMQAPDR